MSYRKKNCCISVKGQNCSARLLLEARNRGRTQEQIAQVLSTCGKKITPRYVGYLVEFARFIHWHESLNRTIVPNPEFALHEVTERKFRMFWAKRKDLAGKA